MFYVVTVVCWAFRPWNVNKVNTNRKWKLPTKFLPSMETFRDFPNDGEVTSACNLANTPSTCVTQGMCHLCCLFKHALKCKTQYNYSILRSPCCYLIKREWGVFKGSVQPKDIFLFSSSSYHQVGSFGFTWCCGFEKTIRELSAAKSHNGHKWNFLCGSEQGCAQAADRWSPCEILSSSTMTLQFQELHLHPPLLSWQGYHVHLQGTSTRDVCCPRSSGHDQGMVI